MGIYEQEWSIYSVIYLWNLSVCFECIISRNYVSLFSLYLHRERVQPYRAACRTATIGQNRQNWEFYLLFSLEKASDSLHVALIFCDVILKPPHFISPSAYLWTGWRYKSACLKKFSRKRYDHLLRITGLVHFPQQQACIREINPALASSANVTHAYSTFFQFPNSICMFGNVLYFPSIVLDHDIFRFAISGLNSRLQ